ncbi:MAG: (d)CMP kinase [Patescibacteria group bacterium]
MKPIIITIDGPAGSGKGTTARGVAHILGYVYIDSGAMYRAITWYCLERGITSDGDELKNALKEIELGITPDWQVTLNGEVVADSLLRTREVNQYVASVFARISAVRAKVTKTCQRIIQGGGYVLDGRDASTIIAPKAELKIYLDADPYERARRRALESGDTSEIKIEEMLHNIILPRDQADAENLLSSKSVGITIDTTHLSPEEQISQVYHLAMAIINQ